MNGARRGKRKSGQTMTDHRGRFGDVVPTKSVDTLSTAVNLPTSFLLDLLMETNDWSFVVKAHALLETAVTTLLVAHLERPALEKVIAEDIEMSKRIAMLSALNVCTRQQREMMRRLGRLRNRLVHTAHGTLFTFRDYLKGKSTRQQFWTTFGVLWGSGPENKVLTMGPEDRVFLPRLAIWSDVVGVLVETASALNRKRSRAALRSRHQRQALLSLMESEREGPESLWYSRGSRSTRP